MNIQLGKQRRVFSPARVCVWGQPPFLPLSSDALSLSSVCACLTLQRRFSALEDETRAAAERTNASATLSTPRNTAIRTPRERSIAAELRAENEADLAKLDEQITALRRKHDELVHANMEKRSELDRLQDKLADLSKEAQLPSEAENPVMRCAEPEQRAKQRRTNALSPKCAGQTVPGEVGN